MSPKNHDILPLNITPHRFQALLFKWFDQHGRKQLPWQKNKTPYRVWVSEIMLQQTQVKTVIPYFERFMQQFPTIDALAAAPEDQVLHLWAGLGYYSRARNLHRTAKVIIEQLDGIFPDTLKELQQLPGIGLSTAGAIISIAHQKRATILDGNVKRVLARFYGITDPINEKKIENHLWQLAETLTPTKRTADYTQAIMDLGATLCTRSKPSCLQCPFVRHCVAHQQNIASLLPRKKVTKKIPVRRATFIILKKDHHIYLQKRPNNGIWGGLWSLPEMAGKPEKQAIVSFCQEQWQLSVKHYQTLPAFRHTFSHYHVDIFPILIDADRLSTKTMTAASQIWYNLQHPNKIGLPKPVQSLLRELPCA